MLTEGLSPGIRSGKTARGSDGSSAAQSGLGQQRRKESASCALGPREGRAAVVQGGTHWAAFQLPVPWVRVINGRLGFLIRAAW